MGPPKFLRCTLETRLYAGTLHDKLVQVDSQIPVGPRQWPTLTIGKSGPVLDPYDFQREGFRLSSSGIHSFQQVLTYFLGLGERSYSVYYSPFRRLKSNRNRCQRSIWNYLISIIDYLTGVTWANKISSIFFRSRPKVILKQFLAGFV